jgi:hypothetical protein
MPLVDGYNVIRAVEACGSRSGDTSQDVVIGREVQADPSLTLVDRAC